MLVDTLSECLFIHYSNACLRIIRMLVYTLFECLLIHYFNACLYIIRMLTGIYWNKHSNNV